ncbi:MAG: thioesterase family protein [Coprococcus sp.]|nr:thioesterase family protein [Coprococcus sp.]
MLKIGITGRIEKQVELKDTAAAHGSGTLEVFATPAMAALIEETCWKSIAAELEEGTTTVGTALKIRHLAPTPTGMKVWCESKVTEAEGRKVRFDVQIFDETGLIGESMHERFIVQEDGFQKKADAKRSLV